MKKTNISWIICLGIILMLMLSGCAVQNLPEKKPDVKVNLQQGSYEDISFDPDEEIKTLSFNSEEELASFIKTYAGESYSNYYLGGGLARATFAEVAMDSGAVATKAAPAAEGWNEESQSYSETNNQVSGVDEADMIKTDGDYIYTITGNTVFIIKAYPGEDAEVITTIDYDQSNPQGLFIYDDKLAVFGNFYNLDFFKGIDINIRYGMTFFDIYDISDKETPNKIEEYKFEGNYFNARMVDEDVYFVVRSTPEFRREYPGPMIIDGTSVKSVAVGDVFYYNIPYNSAQFVTVHAIDMKSAKTTDSKTVAVESSQNMYMSEENIFITYTEYINEYELQQKITMELLEPKLTDADLELIEKIKATDNAVLSKYEKDSKIMNIYYSYLNYLSSDERDGIEEQSEKMLEDILEQYDYFEFTIVNKIGVDDGNIEVKANGKVPGHIINQFSMDENEDVFRIATTISARWSSYGKERSDSTNNVYALDENLNLLGRLEGLAEDEQIYSTRFIGDRLYMVTFKQVDPFFVIDLSNPRKITELGKLKIPGFSRYLHPYDADTIIGIGQDASDSGRTKGLKISLFDVSDVTDPKEIAKFVTDEKYAQSTALYEHKAFLFSRDKELLVIPAYSYEYTWLENEGRQYQQGYNGAFVFKITKDEINLRGLIDHSKAAGSSRYYYSPSVERSLWIEDLLYTKSPTLLRINEIDDLEAVKDIELKQGTTGDIPIY